MTLLRNIVFSLLFYAGSLLLAAPTAIAALVSQRRLRQATRLWARYTYWLTRHILGIRLRLDGAIPSGPVIVAAKHESHYEALLLPALFRSPAVVMKRELRNIPIWGWLAARHGSIFVARDARSAAMRAMLRQAEGAKSAGQEIVIFPEGTRSDPGTAPPLRPGVSGLYRLLKLPVVPVALSTAHVWPRHGLKRSGIVPLVVGDPIPAGLPRAEFERRLHGAINSGVPQ